MTSSPPPPPGPLDPRRVLLAQAGDRAALDALLRALQERLYRFLLGLTLRPDLAQDALQETFVLLCRRIGWLRDPSAVVPWAYRIARREAFRRLRRTRPWVEFDETTLPPSDEPPETWRRLLAGAPGWAARIAALPPAARVVVELHYGHDLSIQEVAAVLEIPVGTVKSRLAAGIAELRRALATE